MSKQNGQRIVIDASVARAAGEKSSAPDSTNCRVFLEDFMKTTNKILMNQEIYREWNKHESKFAKIWRVHMISKKRMVLIKDIENKEIRNFVECNIKNELVKKSIIKDLHLVEAALSTDEIVISCDDRMRNHLKTMCNECKSVKRLMWGSPIKISDDLKGWIDKNFKREECREIGS